MLTAGQKPQRPVFSHSGSFYLTFISELFGWCFIMTEIKSKTLILKSISCFLCSLLFVFSFLILLKAADSISSSLNISLSLKSLSSYKVTVSVAMNNLKMFVYFTNLCQNFMSEDFYFLFLSLAPEIFLMCINGIHQIKPCT